MCPFPKACHIHFLLIGDTDFDDSLKILSGFVHCIDIIFMPCMTCQKPLGKLFKTMKIFCSKLLPWFFLGKGTSSCPVHIPMVPLCTLKSRRGRLLWCPPTQVPICCSCPAFAYSCQKCSMNEKAPGQESWPTAAIEITLENSYVWVTVINVMLIPTKTMGEKPCGNIYNQLMKNTTPIRLIITMKNHSENTQETRLLSHCLTIGKDPPFKLIQHQNLLLGIQL